MFSQFFSPPLLFHFIVLDLELEGAYFSNEKHDRIPSPAISQSTRLFAIPIFTNLISHHDGKFVVPLESPSGSFFEFFLQPLKSNSIV